MEEARGRWVGHGAARHPTLAGQLAAATRTMSIRRTILPISTMSTSRVRVSHRSRGASCASRRHCARQLLASLTSGLAD